MRGNKKVLIVAYYFPPSGGAGVQRTLKFVKYLREFGWEPVVLTAQNADYPAYDHSLLEEVPEGVKIYRSTIVEPYRLYRRFTGRDMSEATDIATLSRDEEQKRNIKERISEWVRAAFFVPDARIGWLPFAFHVGKKVAVHEKVRLIYSSAPPYTTHLIGLMLQQATGLPWVADFRDSWIGWVSAPQYRPRFSRKLEEWMEEKVLRTAQLILTVSSGVREDLLSRHPHLNSRPWRLLTNGYDAEDFRKIEGPPRPKKLTITYTGSLYGNRNPIGLFSAIEQMLREESSLPEKLNLRFVGRIGEFIVRRIKQSRLREVVELIPYVSHREAISYLLGSDVALLIIDEAVSNASILTGKLYEYIGSGLPILALAPEGEAAELLRMYRLGPVLSAKDTEGIYKVLKEFLSKKQSGVPLWEGMDPSAKTTFERRALTEKLAAFFDSLLSNSV